MRDEDDIYAVTPTKSRTASPAQLPQIDTNTVDSNTKMTYGDISKALTNKACQTDAASAELMMLVDGLNNSISDGKDSQARLSNIHLRYLISTLLQHQADSKLNTILRNKIWSSPVAWAAFEQAQNNGGLDDESLSNILKNSPEKQLSEKSATRAALKTTSRRTAACAVESRPRASAVAAAAIAKAAEQRKATASAPSTTVARATAPKASTTINTTTTVAPRTSTIAAAAVTTVVDRKTRTAEKVGSKRREPVSSATTQRPAGSNTPVVSSPTVETSTLQTLMQALPFNTAAAKTKSIIATTALISALELYRHCSNGQIIFGLYTATTKTMLIGAASLLSMNHPMAVGPVNGAINATYLIGGTLISLPYLILTSPFNAFYSITFGLVDVALNGISLNPLTMLANLFAIPANLISSLLTIPFAIAGNTVMTGAAAAGVNYYFSDKRKELNARFKLPKQTQKNLQHVKPPLVELLHAKDHKRLILTLFMAMFFFEAYRNFSDGSIIRGTCYAVVTAAINAFAFHKMHSGSSNGQTLPLLGIGALNAAGSMLCGESWLPTAWVARAIITVALTAGANKFAMHENVPVEHQTTPKAKPKPSIAAAGGATLFAAARHTPLKHDNGIPNDASPHKLPRKQ